MQSSHQPHVVVFFGGTSGGSDLSRETGYWACEYMPRTRFRVTPVHVTPDGKWQVPLGELPKRGKVRTMLDRLFQSVTPVSPTEGWQRLLQKPVAAIFNVMRGTGGDDGAIQQLGAAFQIPVVGSDAAICQITADKYLCAARLQDVVASPYAERYSAQRITDTIDTIRDHFVPPLFVKPSREESSRGIEEVHSLDELVSAVQRSARIGSDVLVQERAQGQELTVTIIEDGRGNPHILPTTVVVPQRASYFDELAKRREGRVKLHTTSHTQDNPLIAEAESVARDVYDELGMRGFASFDMMAAPDGVELLEVNIVPTVTALTPVSQQLSVGNLHPTDVLHSWIARTIDRGL